MIYAEHNITQAAAAVTDSTLSAPSLITDQSESLGDSLNIQSLHAPVVQAAKSIHTFNGYDDEQKTIDYYWVIGKNFHNGNIKIDDYPVRIRLLCYGLSQQAKFGDNNEEKPSVWNLKANWKWDAWNKQKGRKRQASRKEFIMLSEAILAVQGNDPDLKSQGQ